MTLVSYLANIQERANPELSKETNGLNFVGSLFEEIADLRTDIDTLVRICQLAFAALDGLLDTVEGDMQTCDSTGADIGAGWAFVTACKQARTAQQAVQKAIDEGSGG